LHYEAAGEGNDPVAPVGNEDNGNGLVGAMAVIMALYHRRRTGQGQYLENPQLNATLLMGLHMMRRGDGSVVGARRLDGDRLGIHPLDRLYRTSDGWLAVSARRDDEFRRLVALDGFETVADNGDFADESGRTTYGLELQRALGTVFATATTVDWWKRLTNAGVACEVPAGAHARQQFFDDPEQERLGRVECYQHPRWGQVKDVAVMMRLSAAGTRPGRPAPEVGEHSREILTEIGYTRAEIDELFRAGVAR
jgi:crotonobetainyl-CoA:carnitine CoA-transferase CaiB-like acyl-CoA transferase